jgi:DNA-binding NarL/FixJ family response regulator
MVTGIATLFAVTDPGVRMTHSSDEVAHVGDATIGGAIVVDQSPLVQRAIGTMIKKHARLPIIANAQDPDRAMSLTERLGPTLIVMDLVFAKNLGFELLKQLHERFPSVPVIVFSARDDIASASRCMKLGARAFVSKRSRTSAIARALRNVCEGNTYFDEQLAAALTIGPEPLGAAAGDPASLLSPAELEVYLLIGRGMGSKEIAAVMNRGVRTIETYKTRIKRKLGFSSVNELARHAILHDG